MGSPGASCAQQHATVFSHRQAHHFWDSGAQDASEWLVMSMDSCTQGKDGPWGRGIQEEFQLPSPLGSVPER